MAGENLYDESLTIWIPLRWYRKLGNNERVDLQNYVHEAATKAGAEWLRDNMTPVDVRSELISEEEAREHFTPESRSQVIVQEIYKGGTRREIIERLRKHPMFSAENEQSFIPNYVSHTMNRLRKVSPHE